MSLNIDIDDFSSSAPHQVVNAIAFAIEKLSAAGDDAEKRQDALHGACQLLANERNIIRRSEQQKEVAKLFGYTAQKIEKFIKDIIAERNVEEDPNAPLPAWVDRDKLYDDGFVQQFKSEPRFPIGIYYNNDDTRIKRLTNFTIRPIIHIQDRENNRRIIELSNGHKKVQMEVPSRAFVAKDLFETVLIERGNFITYSGFEKNNYKRVVAWLSEEMPQCYEIKSLGWQPEGFFAFSNRIWHNGNLMEYTPLGLVEIGDTQFISLANSSIHSDTRDMDNPYENDAFLQYNESKLSFEQWSTLFSDVYGIEHAINGLTYVFVSLFKDLIIKVTKCPLLFCYGPKGSGKSDFAESLLWLFFSGKNSENNLMSGINLNPGQITRFAFFNFQERFSNCPGLYNEFDESRIEDWVFGAMKSFYDGEGRMVGDGSTGKAHKTRVQKTRGTMMVVGQYLSTGDDGSVLSRSLTCQFDLSKMEALDDSIRAKHRKLKETEKEGLSSIIVELLNHRKHFAKKFKETYFAQYEKLRNHLQEKGIRPETRLLRNYSLITAVYEVMSEKLTMPHSNEVAFQHAADSVSAHYKLLKETNALAKFWKIIEGIFDRKLINWDTVGHKFIETDFTIRTRHQIRVKQDAEVFWKQFGKETRVLTMRMSAVYQVFAKEWRSVTGQRAPDEATLLKYLQDQPYYIGLDPKHFFHNKNTSGFAFNYDILSEEINLEIDLTDRSEEAPKVQNEPKNEENEKSEKIPF
jgi:hypothetical protein